VFQKAAIPVKVSALAKTKIARTIDYTATILPFEEVNMAPFNFLAGSTGSM